MKTKEQLKRELEITPAFDKRNKDPDKNYGIGSCKIYFSVQGKAGAISIWFYTNWYLPSTVKEYAEIGINRNSLLMNRKESFKTKINLLDDKPITAGSWDYHSKKKRSGVSKFKECQLIKGGGYCNGSCMKAEGYLQILIEKGSDGIFERLEEDYKNEFQK